MHRMSWAGMIGLVVGVIGIGAAQADQPELLSRFIEKHCSHCHGGKQPEAAFNLQQTEFSLDDSAQEKTWTRVFDKVARGEMPPEGEELPTDAVRRQFLNGLQERLQAASLGRQRSEGRAVVRRLNRNEYENTLRDLLGVHVAVKDLLPEDGLAAGFDTVSEGLAVSPTHLVRYQRAIDKALDASLMSAPWVGLREKVLGQQWFDRIHPGVKNFLGRSFVMDGDIGILFEQDPYNSDVDIAASSPPPVPGLYRFRLTAAARNTGGKPLPLRIYWQGLAAHITPGHVLTLGYRDVPAGKPTTIEFVVDVPDERAGRNGIGVQTLALPQIPRYDKMTPAPDHATAPALEIHSLEVDGPIGDWPSAGHRLLFGDLPVEPRSYARARAESKAVPQEDWSTWSRDRFESDPLVPVSTQPRADAERLIREFLPKMFRRPVSRELEETFVTFANDRLDRGVEFPEAVRGAAKAALCSPHFFMLLSKPGPLDDHALASRLSYFLWKSLPDDALLEVAARGELHRPEVLRGQVERMLNDAKSQRFVKDFVGQWLQVNKALTMKPDDAYPEYDTALGMSLMPETELFFAEMLARDRSVTELVHSDWTFLNERLARHYGIAGVDGMDLRKVTLRPEDHRGGVLTHASILKATANGSYTSPIKRGVWVLERLVGKPTDPPPPNVPSVEPDIRGAVTLRQKIEKHRELSACASCHSQIDPPGFALESYDVIGGYRTHYRSGDGPGYRHLPNYPEMKQVWFGSEVTSSAVTASGDSFRNLDDFKQLLLFDRDQLARNVIRKLLVYSTGADIQFADREVIEHIVNTTRERQFGIRSILHEVIQSRSFLSK